MAHYLVVAHQTATSPQLVNRLHEIAERDDAAHFTLVVPETPIAHLLLEDVVESREAARAVVAEAERVLRAAGLSLDRAEVGDPSPLTAIEDELRRRADYDAIVISTLRPGASKWLELDVHHRVQRKLALPVIRVCEGGDDAWVGRTTTLAAVPIPPPPPAVLPASDPDLVPGTLASRWPVVVALMFAYLLITGALALGVSRTFFVVDAIAIVVFAILITGVRLMERPRASA